MGGREGSPGAAPDQLIEVTLREITAETVREAVDLELLPGQERFVAPNAVSISEAHFEPRAWFRAVCAGEDMVGFVMLLDDPERPMYYLWRMMIAGPHQRLSYGRKALDLVVEYVRSRPGASELLVAYVPEEEGPQHFYEQYGFEPTGEVHHGEVVMRLVL